MAKRKATKPTAKPKAASRKVAAKPIGKTKNTPGKKIQSLSKGKAAGKRAVKSTTSIGQNVHVAHAKAEEAYRKAEAAFNEAKKTLKKAETAVLANIKVSVTSGNYVVSDKKSVQRGIERINEEEFLSIHQSFPIQRVQALGHLGNPIDTPKQAETPRRKLADLPRFTGNQLVVLNPESSFKETTRSAKKGSIRMANIRDFDNGSNYDLETSLQQADGLIFDKLNVAIIAKSSKDKLGTIMATTEGAKKFLSIEPERYIYSLSPEGPLGIVVQNDAIATWGIHATNVMSAKPTGKGIRMAILDSGFTDPHPSFGGRPVIGRSFLPSKSSFEDEIGHGTMCAGIACGLKHRDHGYRHGIAHEADLYIGRVLDHEGAGSDVDLLRAIQWAVDQGCKIISMSVGGASNPGEAYSPAFEATAAAALKEGSIIIAAAGNESNRKYGLTMPVVHPANCPSIMAVGALDNAFGIYNGSCAGIELNGGQVDISGPGVDVISSWLPEQYYSIDSGTSLAAPFVAGIAALYWEADPTATAAEIWVKLIQTAKRLSHPAADIGAGLAYYS